MYPFECSKCRNRVYAASGRLASCCTGASYNPLVSICLLVPIDKMEGNHHIHTTQGSLFGSGGQKWCTACNASSLPKVTTPLVQAATCFKCLEVYKNLKEKQNIVNELNSIETAFNGIEFIDEDNPENSFKSELSEVRKELKEASISEYDKILEKIKNLHEKLNHRMMVSARLQKLQEIKL